MYEDIKFYTIGLITFVITYFLYIVFAIKIYKIKIKKLQDMTKDLTEDMLERLKNVEAAVVELKVSFAGLSTTVKIWGAIIAFLFSLLGVYIVNVNSKKQVNNQRIDNKISKDENNLTLFR